MYSPECHAVSPLFYLSQRPTALQLAGPSQDERNPRCHSAEKRHSGDAYQPADDTCCAVCLPAGLHLQYPLQPGVPGGAGEHPLQTPQSHQPICCEPGAGRPDVQRVAASAGEDRDGASSLCTGVRFFNCRLQESRGGKDRGGKDRGGKDRGGKVEGSRRSAPTVWWFPARGSLNSSTSALSPHAVVTFTTTLKQLSVVIAEPSGKLGSYSIFLLAVFQDKSYITVCLTPYIIKTNLKSLGKMCIL